MGTTYQIRTQVSQNFYRVFIPILVALSLLASQLVPFVGASVADAADPGVDKLGFEIDGNFSLDSNGTSDWATRPYESILDSTDPHMVFAGGNKGKENDRASWEITDGNAPDKADLTRIYTDFERGTYTVNGEEEFAALLRIGAERVSGTGDTWVSFELNQASSGPFVINGVPTTPTNGDLLVTFWFPGNVGDTPIVQLHQWSNGSWGTPSGVDPDSMLAAVNTSTITNPFGDSLSARKFLELSIDVSFLFGPDAPCLSFAEGWARSRSSDSGSANLQDFVAPFPFGFDTCADVTLKKEDTAGNPQAGVEFELYEGDTAEGTPLATCTTDENGECPAFTDLEPGTYTAYEVAPPVGFKFSEEGRSQTFTLEEFDDRTIVFSNPPITYAIDVQPDDETNAVGFEHEFDVTLTTDFIFDYDTGEYEESDQADIPLAGETVDLAWTGPPSDSGIVDVDGTSYDKAATAECTTDEDGTCTVTVKADVVGGPGTLTASYQTPLDGPAATDPAHTTAGGYFSEISDSGDKSWIGYRAELGDDADNPLGEDHTFTATVWEVQADGTEVLAEDGVTVTFDWAGPTGSGIVGDGTCTTSDGDGTCQVTVSSPDDAGSGTLSIVQVSGEIVDGETLTIDYEDEQITDDMEASKTWWDYRVSIDDDAVNPVAEEHPFVVTVERNDGSGWGPVPDGTTLDFDWTWAGDDPDPSSIVDEATTCDGPGTATTDGVSTCVVTVVSDAVGTGSLTVTGIAGTTLSGYNDDEPFSYDLDHQDIEEREASKTWVDVEIGISFDAENPVGESHVFTVTASIWDDAGGEYVPVPDGTVIDLGFSDASLVADDGCADPGTTDGACTVTTTAPDAATSLTVTVLEVTDVAIDGYPGETATFGVPEGVDATKVWIEYRIVGDDDAYNLAGDPHDFTLTAQERRPGGDWEPLKGVLLDVSLSDGSDGTMDASDCTEGDGTDEDGQCTVTVSSDNAGSATVLADGILGIDLLDGVTATSTTTWDVGVDDAEQTKTWLEYRATTGPDAINLVGDPHTFDVDVEVNDGTGWTDVPDGTTLTWTWFGHGSVDTEESTCGTDGTVEGTCQVVVNSGTPGSGTLTITGIDAVDVVVGDQVVANFTRSDFDDLDAFDGDTATKTWIDYDVAVSGDAVNPLGEGHTFLVSVTYDAGDGPTPAVGATVSGDFEGDEVECTTRGPNGIDADLIGTCEIVVESPGSAGSGTLTITDLEHTFHQNNSLSEDFEVEFEAGDIASTKTWRDYRANVAEDAVNLTGDPHEFTVTIEQSDDGESWTSVPDGTTVSGYAWTGEVGSVDLDAAESTCFGEGTDDGVCTIVVDSDEPGTGTLSITDIETVIDDDAVEAHLDGAPFEFELDEGNRTAASKTWVAIDVALDGDAVNNVDDPHDFIATVTYDDGSGEPQPLSGATVSGTFDWVGDAPDLALECETGVEGTCALTVAAPGEAARGTLTLDSVTFTLDRFGEDWDFDVDLAGDIGLDAEFEQPTATKDWADYTLEVTPPSAVNLLPTDPEHTFTVRLGSSDTSVAPIADQEIGLALDSTVATITQVVDADGITTYTTEDDAPETCTTLTDGTCEVTVTTTDPGTADLTASFATTIDEASFELSDTGSKLWTTFRVRVTPDAAQNLLGTPHEFTVWVEQTDDGETWFPVEGAVPDLSVTNPAEITGTDCDEGTGDDGSCTVTIDSVVTGAFTLLAEYEGVVGTQSATFSDSGEKQWIDYQVSVDPLEDENLVGTDHVFTVTVETDLGDGFVPVPGAIPTVDLQGVGDITSTTCTDGTGEDGTCTVTITSNEPGLSTLTATYEGSAGIGEQETETADFDGGADKLWVNYLLEVDPGEAINALNDPHVFTITLERDEGDGPFAVSGEEVDLAIEGPGTITSVEDGTVDDGDRTGTCTTDTGGTCEVTIVSGEPGTTTLTATYGAEVGETTGTFTETGTKHWAAIDLVKEAQIEPDEDGIKSLVLDEGESEAVTYEYTITNIGPVPLDISSLVDDVLGTIDLPAGLRLEPGESTTVTAVDTIDADAGSVTNTGLVTGIADDGTEVTDTDVETVFVTEVLAVILEPGISVDKSVVSGTTTDTEGNEVVALTEGETATIGYEFLVTNTGDDVLVDLTLVDDKIGDLSEEFREAAIAEYGAAALPIGGSVVVSATYETTAADFEAGLVTNVVNAGAVGSESRASVTDTDEATVAITEVLAAVEERPLPRTGVEALQLFLLGLLTAMLGLAALLGTRRRRTE